MSPGDRDAGTSQSAAAEFTTTHWSVVLAAGQSASPAAQAALEQLCRAYWYPLYAYVRRRGYSPEDAQDLTQSFFERLLERDLRSCSGSATQFNFVWQHPIWDHGSHGVRRQQRWDGLCLL